MRDTIDKVSERLTQLEVTVAKGFVDMKQQFAASESRDQALAADIRKVLQAVTTHGAPSDRTDTNR